VRYRGLRPAAKTAVRPAPRDAVQATFALLEENKQAFGLEDPGRDFALRETVADARGQLHVLLQQHYRGVPVWGGEMAAHVDGMGLYALNARYSPTPGALHSIAATVPAVAAAEIAAVDLGLAAPWDAQPWGELLAYNGPQSKLYVWAEDPDAPRLVWHVELRPDVHRRWYYFVDAHNGQIVHRYSASPSDGVVAVGAIDLNGDEQTLQVYEDGGEFYMVDYTRPIFDESKKGFANTPRGTLLTMDLRGTDLGRDSQLFFVASEDNSWSDPVAVSAHANMGRVFEFFFDSFGRRGIDGEGSSIVSLIHVTEGGESMGNAYWNGRFIAYGDGDESISALAASLDIAGHEFGHGVIERTVNLQYEFESGALNESFADVFGALIDDEDWLLGEDVVQPEYFPSGALRNMADPHNGGDESDYFWQPAHMDEFADLDIDEDNGGVHVNSGIVNRAAFLIAQEIGREKTAQLYYRILDARYLNSRARFVDMRLAALLAASDLFGEESDELAAVAAAFAAVGITGDEEVASAPEDLAPVEGEQWLVVVNAEEDDTSLFLVRPEIVSDDDIVQLTSTQVFVETGNSVSVADDGSFLLFIDEDNFIRGIGTDGSEEEVLSDEGEWSSLALSPDGSKLAATTVYEDSTIFIFDLDDPDRSQEIKLYSPTTQSGIKVETVLFADALDWDLSSRYLVYDAYNVVQASGDTLGYWDINLIDVESGKISALFAALPEGVHMGNPSFAQVNDRYLVFDLFDDNVGANEIGVVDLFEREVGIIVDTDDSFAFPRFSSDDSKLVFETYVDDALVVRQIGLTEDHLGAAGEPEDLVFDAQSVTWFTIGERPDLSTAVEEESAAQPTTWLLRQNYPNPFNPETQIAYSLREEAAVSLEVYDALGRRVATLVDRRMSAGEYVARWAGVDERGQAAASGVYFYVLSLSIDGKSVQREVRKMALLR
jgi:Zn-dependent metalloprotease